MSKKLIAGALLLVALSSPAFAAPRRDDGDRPDRSGAVIGRIIDRILKVLDNFDWSWPKP